MIEKIVGRSSEVWNRDNGSEFVQRAAELLFFLQKL